MRVVLFCAVLALVGCASTAESTNRLRTAAEIKVMIRRNLHFNLMCLCRTGNERTGLTVRRELTEADIPTLALLLSDEDGSISSGASETLVAFGEAARPELESVAHVAADGLAREVAKSCLRTLDQKKLTSPGRGGE